MHKVLITGIIFLLSIGLQAQYQYPFQNPDTPTEERIDNLLQLMTLDEKVNCLSTVPDVPRLGIKGAGHVEGLHGLAQGGPSNWGKRNPQPTTIFPQAIGLAMTWDTAMIRKAATVEAYETRYMFQSDYNRGGLVVRAPNADIGRDIRWGRNEECFGEDAWFNAQMTVQFIEGLQGNHPKYWMTASLMKHFLANSNEDGRDSSSSNFNSRLFREYYSYPFYKGITQGGSRAYMAAYNAYNNVPMTIHPVLKNITVNEWGQNGIICTDGGAYQMLVTAHKYYPDLYKAAEGCLKAGINQFLDDYREGVYGALANGYLNEADLDNVLRGVFRVMIKLGQLDPDEMVPYKKIGAAGKPDPCTLERHKKIALEVTQKSIVLLKNEKQTLPLQKKNIESVAVIGQLADTVMLDWYSGTPPYRVTPLQGIKNHLSNSAKVHFVPNNNYNQAVEIAQKSDVVIMVVGNDPTCSAGWKDCPVPSNGKEAVDRKVITLEQECLIKKVHAVNKKVIVVLQSSFPYAINWTQENVPAILHITHASQETGSALANVLFGNYNPAGRLVQTWPTRIEHLPSIMDYDITKGRTYMYFKHTPLYPFGFGLSYTQFKYSDIKTNAQYLKPSGELKIMFNITNTGKYDGEEVAQLYVTHLNSTIERPLKELKAFNRFFIKKGETKSVYLTLKAEDMAYWDADRNNFVVETDKIKLMVGASSSDIRLSKTIKIKN